MTFTATENHALWVDNYAAWVDVGGLHQGDLLLSVDGTRLSVASVEAFADTLTVHNLTIADIHTYYILAGNTPVLVHNTGCRASRWTSQRNLDEHFAGHGEEMVFSTQAEYRYAAEDLMCTCSGRRPGVMIRQDGNTRYFLDPETGEFGVMSGRGIVSYYVPKKPVIALQ